MADCAVIFDVDGVLLELTSAEEDVFFRPFEKRYGITNLSRDWNAYRVRNDDDIMAEILETHGLPATEKAHVITDYIALLQHDLESGALQSVALEGARDLLEALDGTAELGIATANFLAAAKLRLVQANLWTHVAAHAFGAEGGGHKRQTVARAIKATGLATSRIVYVGDNLNDVEAGLANGVNFIAFNTSTAKLDALKKAGASHASNNHVETLKLIRHLLR